MPVQSIDLEKLLKDGLTGGNSSLPLQSELSDGSQPEEEGNSTFHYHRHNKDSMLRFLKSSLRFSVAISLENLTQLRQT